VQEPPARKINPGLLSTWSKRLKGIMITYESQVYEIDRLNDDLQTVKTMEEEANTLLELHQKNLSALGEEDTKDYNSIQKFRKHLLRKIEFLEQLISDNSSSFARQLMREKKALKGQLNSREGVEKIVLQIQQEIEVAKHELLCETAQRNELEMLLEVEISEVNKKILLESQARYELSRKLERAMEIKKNITGNLGLLKENLQMIIEHQEHEEATVAEERRNKLGIPSLPYDIISLLDLIRGIETKVSSLGTMIDFTEDDCTGTPSIPTKKIEELSTKVAREIAVRKSVEERNIALESQIANLQNLLFEERLARMDAS